MAKKPPSLPTKQTGGIWSKLFGGMSAKRYAAGQLDQANEIDQADTWMYGAGSTTVAALLQSGSRLAQDRQTIYRKWSEMEVDSICSTALKLLVTSALGGHETTGQTVFIEKSPSAQKNPSLSRIVEEISKDLTPLLNTKAFSVCYTGAAFGDSYGRVYSNSRGVVDIYIDELVRPVLVQPFERGSRTVGYAVYTGEKSFERLNSSQMARFKMPRTQWIPQTGVVEKSLRIALTEDDVDKLPLMPSMAGGSLLHNAENPYDNLVNSIKALVAQRWRNTLNHTVVGVQMSGMSGDQQKLFYSSVENMYKTVKKMVSEAIAKNEPITDTLVSLLPMWDEKQLITLSEGQPAQQTVTVEDIMFHAKMLAGAFGVDLAMLGFAEILAGGLGEGGFFRVSAQAAESARIIRSTYSEFCEQIIDAHTLKRYGVVFPKGQKPWEITYYSSISALRMEQQAAKNEEASSGMVIAQFMQLMKDLGANKEIMEHALSKIMKMDEDDAKVMAGIMDMKPPVEVDNEPV